MSSIQGMNNSINNNRKLKGERRKLYDKDRKYSGIYGKMHDHKKMSSYEFDVFKREQSEKRKIDRKRQIMIRVFIVIITIAIVALVLNSWQLINVDFFRFQEAH